MKLVPATRTIDADWCQGSLEKRWALVGKTSGYIHCMFDARDEEEATKILEAYSIMRLPDAGYDLYEVPID